MTFKPMLAGKVPEDLSKLNYPVLASPKLDGIRCIIRDGVAVSRKLKPIPNAWVQEQLKGLPDGIDGELMVEGGFNECQSFFMSKDKADKAFWFFAFDWQGEQGYDFETRLSLLTMWSEEHGHNNLHVVEHVLIANAQELSAAEALSLADGFEGVMVRDPKGQYKFGRSTTREGGLLKLKQFVDEEATVVGFEERMHNMNELEADNLGLAKRSHTREGMVPAGDLGALLCVTDDGASFSIGSGFTQAQRERYWQELTEADGHGLIGETVTFKHQPDPGGRKPGQAPRFPVFKGFRHEDDI